MPRKGLLSTGDRHDSHVVSDHCVAPNNHSSVGRRVTRRNENEMLSPRLVAHVLESVHHSDDTSSGKKEGIAGGNYCH